MVVAKQRDGSQAMLPYKWKKLLRENKANIQTEAEGISREKAWV